MVILTFCTKWELEDIFIVFSTGRKINLISYNIITMHTVAAYYYGNYLFK